MKLFRISFLLFIVLFSSCNNELEQPTSLLSQVLDFYKSFDREQTFAFATGSEISDDLIYIYFAPQEGATNFQYFQTNSRFSDPANLDNYNSIELPLEDISGGKLKRFVRNNSTDVYTIITYQIGDVFFMSSPVLTQKRLNSTRFQRDITVDKTNILMPIFDWRPTGSDSLYLHLLTDEENNLISTSFSAASDYMYGGASIVVPGISLPFGTELISNQNYSFTVYALNAQLWANRVIQTNFDTR